MNLSGVTEMSDSNFDPKKAKKDFPLLERTVNGNPIVYLDSAATSQKPIEVIDRMSDYYKEINSNVHRGAYHIAELATAEMEEARHKVHRFINSPSEKEIIFTKNATEAINLVAYTWARSELSTGDVILLSSLEHHSNIVPWQQLASEIGIEIRWIPLTKDGCLNLENLDELLKGVKLLCVTAVSNALGTINPVKELVKAAHSVGAICLVDACQSVPHFDTDVSDLGADFIAFSGHKMCAPTGIGILWGRLELLEKMPPFLGGGEMILNVTTEGFTTNELPWKFEAGTPPIGEIIGLGVAISYLEKFSMKAIREHEQHLTSFALEVLNDRFANDLVIHGPDDPLQRSGVISFSYRDVHPHDLSQVLDQYGVCVRAGHHCCKPLMKLLGLAATTRASLYIYNDESDIEVLADAINEAGKIFN